MFDPHSQNMGGPAYKHLVSLLDEIEENELREMIVRLASPRHYRWHREANRATAEWLEQRFSEWGYKTYRQGRHENVIAVREPATADSWVLVGAHYDSVSGSPGADDNASGLVGMLVCARTIAMAYPRTPVCFVAFNREEEGALGSKDFVLNFLPTTDKTIRLAIILEMIGYCDPRPGSQWRPSFFPFRIPSAGNFLGVVGGKATRKSIKGLHARARTLLPDFGIRDVHAFYFLKKLFPILLRSDHEPFWDAGIPAMMWTDTAELRNPHYHRETDTPDRLDYGFLKNVIKLLVFQVLGEANSVNS